MFSLTSPLRPSALTNAGSCARTWLSRTADGSPTLISVSTPTGEARNALVKVRRLRETVDGFAAALEGAIAEFHGEVEPT